jgi:hypothetical protein
MAARTRPRLALGRFRRALAGERAAGADFDEAWASSRKPAGLRAVLEATEPAWQRAYVGEPARRSELALPVLLDAFDDGHRERSPGPGRMVA